MLIHVIKRKEVIIMTNNQNENKATHYNAWRDPHFVTVHAFVWGVLLPALCILHYALHLF
ncbi:hypothetical protein L248_2910 [Schleiferilactobacillus shenzhenensis LY-73]|uniref:Uncharacterized protein n=1 Tax=Schleiferilactobacillus shenzhenensis LY-73 TaxID=1231336 RepID=U4TP58_9LACO|nr:hypothetical protein L248_2910 [Schleiferilactobacillus shenzhenensis LY-73]